jgi:hypothetical protein
MSPILGSRGISPRGYGFAGAGKPNAPVSVSATDVGTARAFNNGAATVSFTSGGDNGAPISSFTVTSSPGGFTASGASSPLTVTGLQSATSYTFSVTATNSVGTSDASTASSAITATTIPQPVTIGTATCASGQAYTGSANVSVPFTAGATGGKTVTFTATSSSTNTGNNTASPVTVSETVGNPTSTARTYTVVASNANGSAAASSASNSVSAISLPQAPTIGTPTCATGQAYTGSANVTVPFTAGATGGAAVSTFTATSSGGGTATNSASPVTISRTVGTSYTFTVTATNSSGTSAASGTSASVLSASVPQTPTIGSVGINSTSNVTVNWSGATGGSTITSVAVTSSPSLSLSYSGTSTALSVTGSFAGNQAYTFTMTTTNAYGTSNTSNGVASTPNPVIPAMYIAGGAWNPTTTGGSATDYTKRDTGTFRFDTETASTSSNALARFWAKPASISNPGSSGYLAGGVSGDGTYLRVNAQADGTLTYTNTEKISFTSASWSSIAATTTTSSSFGSSTSIENGATAGYIIQDAGSYTGSSNTCVVNKMNYSNETFSNVRSFSTGIFSSLNTPYSYEFNGFGYGQNNTPEISNPGTKAYLRGKSQPATTGNLSFYHWSFSTDNYSTSTAVLSADGNGGAGSQNHQFTNGTTAGYSFIGGSSAYGYRKMPFSTETWSYTGTTPSVARFSPSVRGYTAGGAAYHTAGSNSGTWNTTTDKITFSNDTRSTIAQTCNGTSYGTSLASAH